MTDAMVKAADEKFCESCGKPVKIAAEICPNCGVRQKQAPVSGKNKTTAGVLAILLGGIGVHKFYMGKIGMGIVYVLFCWTAIPALVGLIEGIIYLTKSDEEFALKLAKKKP